MADPVQEPTHLAATPPDDPLIAERHARRPWRVVVFAMLAVLLLTLAGISRYSAAGSKAVTESNQQAALMFADLSARLAMMGLEEGSPMAPFGRKFAEQAAGYYITALDIRPNDVRIRLSAALMYDRLGRQDTAQALLSEGLRRNLGEGGLLPLILYYSGKPPEARWGLEPAVKKLLDAQPAADIFWAGYYQRLGMTPLADQTKERAAAEAERLFTRVLRAFFVGFLLALVGLGLIVARAAGLRWLGHHQVALPPWGVALGLQTLVLFVVATQGLGVLAALFVPRQTTAVVASYLGATVVTLVWLVLVLPRGVDVLAAAGWRLGGGRPLLQSLVQVLRGVGGYALVLPMMAALGLASRAIFPNEPLVSPVVNLIRGEHQPGAVLALALLVVVAAPIVEETLFRGILFGGLRRRMSLWPAALLSGFLFALVHFQPVVLLPFLGLGVVLAVLYERSGSLLPPTVAHAAFNAMSLTAVFLLR